MDNHTKDIHPSVQYEAFIHTKKVLETFIIPAFDIFDDLTNKFETTLVKEVKEFEKLFDELDDEYKQGVKKIKSLEITNRNLVRQIESLMMCLILCVLLTFVCLLMMI